MKARKLLAFGALAAIGACSFPPITFQDEGAGSTTATTSSAGGASTTATTSASMGGHAGMGGMGGTGGTGGVGGAGGTTSAGGAPVTSSTTGNGGTGGVDCTNPDADGDTYDAVECGGNDCDDADSDAHPGQTAFFSKPRKGKGGYDYDCDDMEKPAFRNVTCGDANDCPKGVFVNAMAIACGQQAAFGDCKPGFLSCSPPSSPSVVTQACR